MPDFWWGVVSAVAGSLFYNIVKDIWRWSKNRRKRG
jgi:hypothetical protein